MCKRLVSLPDIPYNCDMKLIYAMVIMLAMASVLGFGILKAVSGNPWYLVVGLATGVYAFAKYGCLT